MVIAVLMVSVCFQLVAAMLAIRLIRPSRGKIAWVIIATALLLRAANLLYETYLFFNTSIDYPLILADELMGLTISALLMAGVWSIKPLFTSFQEAEEGRELYTHSISHDLRAPLTVIQGYAEFLSNRLQHLPLDEESRNGLDSIRHSCAQMNALIQDLVDAARSTGKNLELNTASVDLKSFLPKLAEHAFVGCDRSRLMMETTEERVVVEADPERLERILINLISNALKYSPTEKSVILRALPSEESVILSVQDFGRGISPRDLPLLFSRFFQGKGEEKKGGVGLGLYISRILLEAHGGRIWVQSRPGEGSTFFFSLPAAAGDASAGYRARNEVTVLD